MIKRTILYVFVCVLFFLIPNAARAQQTERFTEETERLIDTTTETPVSEETEPPTPTISHFPILNFGGNFGAIVRNDVAGGFVLLEGVLDNSWIFAHARAIGAAMGNNTDGPPMLEVSGNLHLLAIGVSDITYRRYMDNWDFRLLAGFSYTRHVDDVVRVDINLGFAYFDERFQHVRTTEGGLQISARITARVWQLHNTLSFSGYQNVRLNNGGIDLSGTRIICEVGTVLECEVPPPDPSAPPSDGILTWQTAGVIIQNRTFIWIYREGDNTFGPELELRFEQLPLVGSRFWAMLSLRWNWSLDHL
jgi:hypothetical protein